MKIQHKSNRFLTALSSKWLGVCSVSFCFLTAGQSMAQNVWSGADSANWNDAGNWSLGLPVDNQALTFNGTPPQTVVGPPDVATVNNDLTGLTAGNILFGNGGPAAASPNNSSVRYTLTGNPIFLNGNISNNASIQASATSLITITDIIDLDISLKANSTWTLSNNGAGNTGVQHGLIVNGLISENGGSFGIQKNNSGALTLANAGNSFTGPLTVTNGNTTVTGRLDISGQASSIGAGSVVNLSGGVLAFSHSAAPTSPWTFNRDINLTAGTTLQNSNSAGPFTINGNFTHTGGNKTLVLGGGSVTNLATIQSILTDSATPGTLTISKGDTGTWGLSGQNTFTGQIQVNNGSLAVATVGDSGGSSIGNGTVGIRLGNGGSTGVLTIVGSGGTTARQVQIGNGTGTGGANIKNNGSGTVVFNTANFNNQIDYNSGTIASNRTLFLGGSSTAVNEITGAIRDNLITSPATGSANVGLTKEDAGRWILAGANLYTGTTTVSGGVLQLSSAAALPAGGVLNLGGGVLGLGTGDFTRALGTTGGQVSIGVNGGFAAYGADRSVNIGGAGATVNWNATAPTISGNTIVLGSSTATHTVTFVNPLNAGTGLRFIQANDGAAAVDGIIAGNITNTGNSISKTGAGTLQLNGTGNAWGGTFIDGGTLRLGAAGVLPDATGLVVKRAGNAGNTDGKLDLAGNDETIGNLTLGSPSGEGNALSAGQNPAVVSSGSAATLTIPGNLIYDAGNAGFLNGQATISANIVRSGNPFITVGDGAAADDLVISGKISGSFAFLTKDGSGTLVLSGANDYVPTASTNVNAGTLVINGNSSAVTKPFNVNGTSTLGGNGSVGGNVNVGATGNLSPGATGAVGTFSILGNLDMSGQAGGTGKLVYSLDTIAASDKVAVTGTLNLGIDVLNFSDFTFTDLPGLQNGTYKLITSSGLTGGSTLDPTLGALTGTIGAGPAQGTLQLNGGDLELVVTGAPSSDPFEDWAGAGVNFDDDANNDGVKNGLAWLLGAQDKNVNALGKLPVVTQTGGSLKLTFDMLPAASRDGAQLFVEHSSNLGISDPWTGALVLDANGGSAPVTFIVSDSDLVDPENPLDVEATISSTEAASGKLFGRVRAER